MKSLLRSLLFALPILLPSVKVAAAPSLVLAPNPGWNGWSVEASVKAGFREHGGPGEDAGTDTKFLNIAPSTAAPGAVLTMPAASVSRLPAEGAAKDKAEGSLGFTYTVGSAAAPDAFSFTIDSTTSAMAAKHNFGAGLVPADSFFECELKLRTFAPLGAGSFITIPAMPALTFPSGGPIVETMNATIAGPVVAFRLPGMPAADYPVTLGPGEAFTYTLTYTVLTPYGEDPHITYTLSGGARSDLTATTLVNCSPPTAGGGDSTDRGFYIESYPGASLDTLTVHLVRLLGGPASFQVGVVVTLDAYDGPLVGSFSTAAPVLINDTETAVTIPCGNAAIPYGRRVCFRFNIPGDVNGLYYLVANSFDSTHCPNIRQTNGTEPPLSTFRRNGVKLSITGQRSLYVPAGQLIQPAIDAALAGDTISVAAGTYTENLRMRSGVSVEGAGAGAVSLLVSGDTGVFFDNCSDMEFSGFSVLPVSAGAAKTGIDIQTGSPVVKNNVVSGFRNSGIRVSFADAVICGNRVLNNGDAANGAADWGINCVKSGSLISNNLIKGNEGGCRITAPQSNDALFINNTVVQNTTSGLVCESASPAVRNNIVAWNDLGIVATTDAATPVLSYNDVWNNSASNYKAISSGVIVVGPGSLSVDPAFDPAHADDYRLLPGSPCINAGNPDPGDKDVDGSRNDMGWTGGPCVSPAGPPILHVDYRADGSDNAPTVSSYNATGGIVTFSLARPLSAGTTLMVVNNTGTGPITGTFDNLAQGQAVDLTFGGVTYPYVAHYYGGTGNDLVLLWRNTRALSWGWNNLGQLGNGTMTNLGAPAEIYRWDLLAGKTIVSLSGGTQHSVALCVDGTIATFGDNQDGQLGTGDLLLASSSVPGAVDRSSLPAGIHPVAVSAGGYHTLCLFSDGKVYAWGDNRFGQTGSGDAPADQFLPVRAKGVLTGRRVIAISAGHFHSLALCDDGFVAAWGLGSFGRLGNGSTDNHDEPVAVNLTGVPAGETIVAVAAGLWQNMALTSTGKVFSWGENSNGQLGDGTTNDSSLPVLVSGLTARAIYGGGTYHSMAQRHDGKLVAWGANVFGQLGTGGYGASHTPILVSEAWLAGQSPAGTVSGDEHVLSLRSDGTLYAWGLGNEGRLGNNNTSTHTQPWPMPVDASALNPGDRWLSLASGAASQHSLAIVAMSLRPDVQTTAAVLHPDGTVLLTASVNPQGRATEIRFVYGPTGSYDSEAAATPLSYTGFEEQTAGALISGLELGRTYQFRVVFAQPGAGGVSGFGEERIFTTLTRLQMWRHVHFATIKNTGNAADSEDPDNDGISNLMEFAFGLHPLKPDAAGLPEHQADSDAMSFQFTEPDTHMGLIYGAQWSRDMSPGSWLSLPDRGAGALHSFKLSTAGLDRAFLRLIVTNTGP